MTTRISMVLRCLALGMLLGACGGGPQSADDGARPGDGDEPVGPTPGPHDDLCAPTGAPPSPLRRLTAFEYRNTVADLLGLESLPALSLPADEVTRGFNNNADVLRVTSVHADAYQAAAETLAALATEDLVRRLPCEGVPTNATAEDTCAAAFVSQFGRRAFRRPLDAAERERALALYRIGKTMADFAKGIELVVNGMLQSPSFLYRLETGVTATADAPTVPLTQYEIASRLSYFLWATMPDDDLLDAAENGRLGTRDAIAAAAKRMLEHERARAVVADFHEQWLGVSHLVNASKDAEIYPQWSPTVRDALLAQARAFSAHALFDRDHRLHTLLTSTDVLASQAIGAILGVEPGDKLGDSFAVITLPAQPRAGILTLPAVMAAHALPDQSSPVHRGVFVRERLMCQPAPPVPANIDVMAPEPDPNASTRERFAQHREDPACAACHRLLDPIGVGFENFDGIGRFRVEDAGKPIDARGEIVDSADIDGSFDGVPALAARLAGSAQVRACVASQWFRYGFGRLETEADACTLARLGRALADSDGDIHALLIQITQSEAFLQRRAP